MKKFYEKSKLGFALMLIGVYVVGMSVFEEISRAIGVESLAAAVFALGLSGFLFLFLKRNGLLGEYGLCKTDVPAGRFLYYLPLIVVTGVNLFNPLGMNYDLPGMVFFILKMLCVGFLEELIFRGFLFKAMERDSLKWAVIVSSVTFGLGHIMNLLNGSGMDVVDNLVQIVSAIAFGFLFVVIFHRGGSLLPCILSHSLLNACSAFSREWGAPWIEWTKHILLCLIVVGYTLILLKTLPKKTDL
ncbi:MAG: CPBP family intramembrane metalloprotease [Ruminococcaceae bacterium]|nr:CPBP family intramembrane metalloprotease [Oscillospiraceae bacterium]